MAQRDRRKMSQEIFSRLIAVAQADGVVVLNEGSARWVKRKSDEDARIMAGAKLTDTLKFGKSRKVLHATHEGRSYLMCVGLPDEFSIPEVAGLEMELTPAFFGIAVVSMNIKITASAYQIKNYVETEHIDVDGYDGHDLSAIAGLFQRVRVFELSRDYEASRDVHRIMGVIQTFDRDSLSLPFSSSTLECFRDVFEEVGDVLPHHALLQGMLSLEPTDCYLQIYRCIEKLYFVPRVSRLIKEMKYKIEFSSICKMLDEHLSWRPREEEALRTLLSTCSEASLSNVLIAFGVVGIGDDLEKNGQEDGGEEKENEKKLGKLAEKAAKCIYKLRNEIVHYGMSTRPVQKSSEEWSSIYSSLLAISRELYDQYSSVVSGKAA